MGFSNLFFGILLFVKDIKMEKEIQKIKEEFFQNLKKASSFKEVEDLRIDYLGRKGKLTLLFKKLSLYPEEKRPQIGKILNFAKNEIEEQILNKIQELKEKELGVLLEKEKLDVTYSSSEIKRGHLHPLTLTLKQMIEIFKKIGFEIAEGPEIETDFYNFEALNIPKEHPARDTQDSFYFTENLLLRTHTSPVQVRYMLNKKPPLRVIAPGRVYRRDFDATHTPMFHQLEGLLVDSRVTFSDLKGVLEYFAREMFGPDRKLRFRPHHFPFTEPSAEVDISCGICGGRGCRACKYSGWLEILGAGMVHPHVLKTCGIDPEKYQGFAFGMGIERIAMLKYNIDDLRLFFDNDLRFCEEF